jgi:hypothetical protein
MPGRRIPGSTGGKRPWTACARRPERSAPEPNGNGRLRSHGENRTGPFGEGGRAGDGLSRGTRPSWQRTTSAKDHLEKEPLVNETSRCGIGKIGPRWKTPPTAS